MAIAAIVTRAYPHMNKDENNRVYVEHNVIQSSTDHTGFYEIIKLSQPTSTEQLGGFVVGLGLILTFIVFLLILFNGVRE